MPGSGNEPSDTQEIHPLQHLTTRNASHLPKKEWEKRTERRRSVRDRKGRIRREARRNESTLESILESAIELALESVPESVVVCRS